MGAELVREEVEDRDADRLEVGVVARERRQPAKRGEDLILALVLGEDLLAGPAWQEEARVLTVHAGEDLVDHVVVGAGLYGGSTRDTRPRRGPC
jgi:hypothetical protein